MNKESVEKKLSNTTIELYEKNKAFFKIGKLELAERQFVVLIYVFSVLIRFVTGAYMKHIETFQDEKLYRFMAEAIARGSADDFRLFAGGYNRVLYSLIISPAFFVKDRYIQTILLQLINSLLVSSTIFPLYLMAKQTVKNTRVRFVCYSLFLLLPELCISVTFASENLFLPLGTWAVLAFFAKPKGRFGNSCTQNFVLGIIVYLLYLCKSAGLVLFFSAITFFLFETVREYKDKERRIAILRRYYDIMVILLTFLSIRIIGKNSWLRVLEPEDISVSLAGWLLLMTTAIIYALYFVLLRRISLEKVNDRILIIVEKTTYIVSFFVVCAMFAVVLIPGMWGEIRQFIISVIPSTENIIIENPLLYIVYGICNIMYVMMAVGILPVIIPAMYSSDLRNQGRRLYDFSTIILFVGSGLTALYMSWTTDGSIPPRGIIRYLCYLWIPYMLCFASMYEKKSEPIDKKRMALFIGITALFICGFSGAKTGSSIDMNMLFYIVYHFTYVMWQLKIPLIAAMLITIPLYHRKREWLFIGFALAITLVWILDNGFILMDHHNRYGMSNEEYEKIVEDDKIIRDNPDEQFIMLFTNSSFDVYKIRESFLGPYSNVFQLSIGSAERFIDATGNLMIQDIVEAYELGSVKYIMIEQDLGFIPEEDKSYIVSETRDSYFIVYGVRDGMLPKLQKAE